MLSVWKRVIHTGFVLLLMVGLIVSHQIQVKADEIDDIQKQIDDLQNQMELSVKATTPLESEVEKLSKQVSAIQAQITASGVRIKELEESIVERDEKIEAQYIVLSAKVRDLYKKSRFFSPFLMFVSSHSAGELTRGLAYKSAVTDEDKNLIVMITADILKLEEDKAKTEADRAKLAGLQTKLDAQKAFFEKEIAGAKKWQAELSGKIASLSARQQAIIDARSGSFTFTLGSGELADEYLSSAKGFQESAPGGYFAVFSFGGYSHRKGMSQYGARGRAEAGRNYREILSYYYEKEPVKKDDTGGNIKVAGHGEIEFETTYLYGIAEMPSSWHMEALKAQAVAARTYAYRYKKENKEICVTQSCQVYSQSKSNNPPQAWKEAVDQTRGEVLEDVVTYYSSTAGGFLRTKGWDTADGNGGGGFIDKAYERLGNSPWLEKAWWREGYSSSGNTCGRANPWLSPEEMADIVNAVIALKTEGIDTSRITPVTTSCWGGNPYSMDELANLVSSHGGIRTATSVSVSQGNGVTNSVTINGISINPSDFRRAFNLRASGYMRIPQYSGTFGDPFFNIVKK